MTAVAWGPHPNVPIPASPSLRPHPCAPIPAPPSLCPMPCIPVPAGEPWLRLHHDGGLRAEQRQALQDALLLGTGTGTSTETTSTTGTGTAVSRIAETVLPRGAP